MSRYFCPGEGYKPFSPANYPWILSWKATASKGYYRFHDGNYWL